MVLSTPEWRDLSRPKPLPATEKKPLVKAGRESKGAGSRRIFSPVFKLQVLDSYRQDADCQGNQRATARKYGIHRRQIQKWLQMETNLRLSVQKSSSALNLSAAAVRPAEARVPGDAAAAPPRHAPAPPGIPEPGSLSDSDEYVNVDEISDSEEEAADTRSSCSSPESREQALDLSSAAKRRLHSADFKAHVLRAFRHDAGCRGNPRATARKFGVHWRHVEKWLKQEVPASADAAPLGSVCLDLSSHKRPLEEVRDLRGKRAKVCLASDEVQESALCLVKHTDKLASIEPAEPHLRHYCHILYPAATSLEHSYDSTLGYLKPTYPFCVYQPWQCCYQQILSARSGFDAASAMLGANSKAYSYAFNVKYEASYVDIPVQYGFGDSVPSKWLQENPLFLHGPPSPYPCLQDRL